MFDQTQMKQLIQAAEQAWYTCPHQTCLIRGCSNEQNIAHQTRNKRNVLRFWSNAWWPSNLIKHDQTRSNSTKHPRSNIIKQHQTRCPNGKMFVHQTMFDGVWSPNIIRLSRPLTVWPLTSTLACLVTKQCWMVFGRQTFIVCPVP